MQQDIKYFKVKVCCCFFTKYFTHNFWLMFKLKCEKRTTFSLIAYDGCFYFYSVWIFTFQEIKLIRF